jgi:hypothetical protein
MFDRYAIFYTPHEAAFAAFGAAWLGWDSAKGALVPHPAVAGVDMDLLTATPRKYGFHATLKAPFRLADNFTEAQLRAAVVDFAANHAAMPLGPFKLVTDHGFLALRPTGDQAVLQNGVAQIVTEFDHFRAPLTQSDIARRRKAGLTARQDAQMLAWGYPFIFEDFHFHMTLSGSLDQATLDAARPHLAALIAPVLPAVPVLDAITLMGQDTAGKFHQLHRAELTG